MQNIESLSYRELQKLAKEHGIPANLKRDALVKKLTDIEGPESCDDKQDSTKSLNAEEYVAKNVVPVMPASPEKCNDQAPCEIDEASDGVATTDITAEVSNETDIVTSSDTADVDGPDEEEQVAEDEEEAFEQEEEEEESPEERIGCKLLGIATPVGQKQVFASPDASKSGTKPYEKYNVHWRYEEYENQMDNAGVPVPAHHGEEDAEDAAGVSPLREGEKLRGVATPAGKSIYFVTPNKTTEKEYLKYNVHWTYEDYLKASSQSREEFPASPSTLHQEVTSIHHKLNMPEESVSSTQTRNPLAAVPRTKQTSTPGSAKKFRFVHQHP